MTMHSAKGLEYDYVYLVGLEEGLFPSQMMTGSRDDLEEERRLFYVAVTRAKQKVFLSHAARRYRYGKLMECEPSRFLEEIDSEYIELMPSNKRYRADQDTRRNINYADRLVSGLRRDKGLTKPLTARISLADFQADDISGLEKGMKVKHPKFGEGKVMEVSNNEGARKAKIKFKAAGEKTLLLAFAKLKILG